MKIARALAASLPFVFACASAPSPSSASSSGAANAGDAAAMKAKAHEMLDALTHAAGEYEMKNGHCPAGIDDVAQPAPLDPWGHAIAFMPASPDNPSNAFVSAGPDGELLTPDDIVARVECTR